MAGLFDIFRSLLDTQTLSPHGICLLWRPELIWTHVISDLLIGLAYFSIPLALAVFIHRRPDVRFGWAIWMFVAFIMLCGVTHFMMIWTLWNPDYGVEALIKAATALVSVLTAMALWPLLPKVLALPSPAILEARVAERDVAVAELQAAMATMVEMRQHEAQQKLLLDELNHRVKNTLTSVQSIAVQSIRGATDPEEFRDNFVQRLMALSTIHNLLGQTEWSGASLHELIGQMVGIQGRTCAIGGADLMLDPNIAVSLGMAFHELSTNAVRHGAWRGEGDVSVEIDILPGAAGSEVRILWRETGGPEVTTAQVRGFGLRLLERGLATELGATVAITYPPTGLVCEIRAPESARLRRREPDAG